MRVHFFAGVTRLLSSGNYGGGWPGSNSSSS
jgi:hypothetical protein